MGTPLVLIVGAGPSGLTLAIELRRAGLDIRIIDKSDHPALHSQALVVQARTLELLQRYGLARRAVSEGRPLRQGLFYSEGKQIASLDLSEIPGRYPFALFLAQNKTEDILREHLEQLGVRAERETELTGVTEEAELTVQLKHADGREETIRPRWVVGCDGAHSVVRTMAGIPFEGGSVALSFFLGDLELEGPDNPADSLAIHLHHGDVLFLGRLTETLTRVIVAVHADQTPDPERVLTLADFQGPMDAAGIRVRVKSAAWMTPFYVNDRQARQYRKGDIFLVGDASHIHSPVGGQGMNTGMQDAANLGWKLVAVASGADESLLDSYQEEREAVGKALLRFTERGLKMATTPSTFLGSIRDALLPHIASLTPVQQAMLGFISETAIEYHSSSVVYDYGGDGSLRAGDRMVDIEVGEQDTRTTLLESWTEFGHLAVLLNAENELAIETAADLPTVPVIALRASDLNDQGLELLGHEPKMLLLRPDGYIGFRGPITKRDEWLLYARQVGLASPYFDPGAAVPGFLHP